MTGFARSEAAHGDLAWAWELKSVNARGLDVRLRLPTGYERLEQALKKTTGEKLSRGTVYATLTIRGTSEKLAFEVNQVALKHVLEWSRKLTNEGLATPPSADGVLNAKGVLEQRDLRDDAATREALDAAIKTSFDQALTGLAYDRRREGAELEKVIADELNEIEKLTGDARASEKASVDAIKARIAAQLSELLDAERVPAERLAQEAAIMAVKADIREELDRLDGHVGAGRALLAEGGAIGRRLDFLTQEFNREANTLCAKAPDLDLKRIGLDLKTVVDQMREQVQNLE